MCFQHSSLVLHPFLVFWRECKEAARSSVRLLQVDEFELKGVTLSALLTFHGIWFKLGQLFEEKRVVGCPPSDQTWQGSEGELSCWAWPKCLSLSFWRLVFLARTLTSVATSWNTGHGRDGLGSQKGLDGFLLNREITFSHPDSPFFFQKRRGSGKMKRHNF